jgi:hypothetical protein
LPHPPAGFRLGRRTSAGPIRISAFMVFYRFFYP